MTAQAGAQVLLAEALREFPVPGYVLDVKQILAAWKNHPEAAVSFKEFRKIWADMRFQYIFSTAPENISAPEWLGMLSESAFGYFYVREFRVRLGAFFLLYMLWSTQREPKSPLRFSMEMWKHILYFFNTDVVSHGLKEVAAIFCRMKEQNAFNFVAQCRIVLPPSVIAGTTTLKKDVRTWDPSPQLGSSITTRLETDEILETWCKLVETREKLFQNDGMTLNQPSQEEFDSMMSALTNVNVLSVTGIDDYQRREEEHAAPASAPNDPIVPSSPLQAHIPPEHEEGPAEMQDEDDGMVVDSQGGLEIIPDLL